MRSPTGGVVDRSDAARPTSTAPPTLPRSPPPSPGSPRRHDPAPTPRSAYFTRRLHQGGGPSFRVRAIDPQRRRCAHRGPAPGRHRQHPAPSSPGRAGGDRWGGGRGPDRRVVAGPDRPPAAPRHGTDCRVDRRRQSHRAGTRGERDHRGRSAGPHAERHARPHRVRVQRPAGLRATAAALRSTASGGSSPTPRTSCAPRSPRSPPTPSCSGGEPPSRKRTSSG